jgi:hypothetical protein
VIRREHTDHPNTTLGLLPARALPASGPSARPTKRLRFLGSLDELVAIGLYRPAFERLCRGDEGTGASPIDRLYLRKLLREEVGRQLGHPLRPIVELILNGADACAGQATCGVVDISVDETFVVVTDSGRGMGLSTIVSRLLVPFATDKVPGVDLGRFGVGFFSALGFGIADPSSFSLQIETGDGALGFSICVTAAGTDPADLTVSIRDALPRSGTRVKLASALLEAGCVCAYLRDTLHFFPKERAIVRLDGVPLNDGRLISGGRLYEARGGGSEGEPPWVSRFHLGGRGLARGITAATYHAGVKVESCSAVGELALLDFPAAVELTEGRDALKKGPVFSAAVKAFYERLIQIAREDEGEPRATRQTLGSPEGLPDGRRRQWMAELAAQVSLLLLKDDTVWSEVAPKLREALVGKDRFMVGPERVEMVLAFLGPAVAHRLFVPESFWAERQWHGFLPGERELLEDEFVLGPPMPLAELARQRPDLRGLPILVGRAGAADTRMVSLARTKRTAAPGPLPCLGSRRAILVREDARAVVSPSGWSDLYALRAAFDRAAGVREADVERALIVSAPLGQTEPRRTMTMLASTGTRSKGA